MLNKKKYFITGVTGFAGPHLAKKLLSEGHEVHALIRGSNGREYDLLDILAPEEIEKINFHYGDLKDARSLSRIFSKNEYSGVFHLAAQSHPPTSFKDPVGTMETNVMGTINLIDAIQRYNPNCVLQFTSTSEVYGDQGKEKGILYEDMPLKPSNPYGTSKAMIDLYMQERCKNGFLKGFITRAFSHTGPRRGKNFSISWDAYHLAMLKNKKNPNQNLSPTKEDQKLVPKKYNLMTEEEQANYLILPVGNLKTKRIVIDARDCVNAYYQLMCSFNDSMNGEAFNVCGAKEEVKEMNFFTNKLIEISGLEKVVKVKDKRVFRPIDIQVQIGDTTKIQKYIKWKPQIPIEKTLSDLFNYWVKKTK